MTKIENLLFASLLHFLVCTEPPSPHPGNVSTAKFEHRLGDVAPPLYGCEISGFAVFVVNKA